MAILTLTTDIGQQDFLTGALKGTFLQVNPEFNIVDISHTVSAQNYPQAAYIIRNAIKHFPKNSFHMILVNLFEDQPEHMLITHFEQQYIGCADNGLLPMILEENKTPVYALPLNESQPKTALHCSSIIANSFSQILNGKSLTLLGELINPKSKGEFKLFEKGDWLEGQIIFIDNFENVVVNITREEFEAKRKGRNFQIILKGSEVIDKICETYADVPPGEKLAHFNEGEYLEIAINQGNAAGLLGLQAYVEKQNIHLPQTTSAKNLLYQTIKIHFGD